MRPDYYLFSESPGRFVVTVSPRNRREFERMLGNDAYHLGRVDGSSLQVMAGKTIIDLPVREMEHAYKAPFREY
jgi:phosphoribosylformylglycinamidine synthase